MVDKLDYFLQNSRTITMVANDCLNVLLIDYVNEV